ncbi:unnamed protein product [Leptosia nina]|uniref:Aldehyde dehydrogenase domain-containing protein n=1 Tax=Leptosia nina TaxID=320188 RepID=A0AAV1J9L3_9NEOP
MAPEIKYTKIFINNEWFDAASGKTFPTVCPHDGKVIANVAEGDKADIDLAVNAAKKAFHRNSEWRLLDASKRGNIFYKFADLVERDAKYLAELETIDNGMVCTRIQSILATIPDRIRYIASLADKSEGTTIPLDGDTFCYTLKQPVGVCGLILPWNAPILMFINKIIAALAAGCTAIVKPAEQTPLTALALAALMKEAGLPPGVVNVVPGYGETAGVALTHHPDVAKISFTGSLEVGKLVQKAAGANNLKRVTLELGGKSPLVIMNDADLQSAIQYATLGLFLHQGQMCIAASRVFVQSGIYDAFVQAMTTAARSLKIGNPAEVTSQYGPQVDEEMMKKILCYIEKGQVEGAKLVIGGKRIGTQGYYIEPTVFADVQDNMTIAKEEIFGPVQSILKFETLEEVIERSNASHYGLAAGIFTTNVTTALQFSKHVEAGIVWVNTYLVLAPQAPFGGRKESGVGRETGSKCLDEYLDVKAVTYSQPKKL